MSEVLSSVEKLCLYCDKRYEVQITLYEAEHIIACYKAYHPPDKTIWLKYQLMELGCFLVNCEPLVETYDIDELDELSCEILLTLTPLTYRFAPGSDRRRYGRDPGSSSEQYNGDAFTEIGE